ncbi:hypothetical protein ABIA30_003943 [Mycobacterium sp. MAA66]|uniref:hypothetical protein n=1 Tax=Mycobacterium sp. MAA66 TaxID=3156297 RepID=UPI003515A510
MKPAVFVAGMAIAGGLAASMVGVGAGVASAAPGPAIAPAPASGPGGPIPTDWDHDHGGYDHDHDHGGWGGPPGPPGPPPGWAEAHPGMPFPNGWAGGWQPQGGFCVFEFCV